MSLESALKAAADVEIPDDIANASADEIAARTRLIENEIKMLQMEVATAVSEKKGLQERLKDNKEKIKVNTQLPYLVGNVVEILDIGEEPEEEEGGNRDLDAARKGKCAVIKTSTRQTIFLPVVGLVPTEKLRPGDLVGVNKDNYLILEQLPAEYDSRVKAMEVDERPSEKFADIGGLDKQMRELLEAVVLPVTHKENFQAIGIKPPKGALLYGVPGTGKTMMARACAAKTKSTFLKLAGPQLVQMFIGDGAKIVRDAFALAKEKQPAIIFIDELDAVGTKRFDSDLSGDREVQRTMLELLNQLDGFSSSDDIKVVAATNRIDILDPALLRSGRLDRKIEFPLPNEEARRHILTIHSRDMNVIDANFDELARSSTDFNGAQLKAVCVEAGMCALRRGATSVHHDDFMEGIAQVQAKKKTHLAYYTTGKLPRHIANRTARTKNSHFCNRISKRALFTAEQIQKVHEHLRHAQRESYRSKDPKAPPVRRETFSELLDAGQERQPEESVLIETKVPFLQTSVYSKWTNVLVALWSLATDRVSVSLNKWALKRYAPHLDMKMVDGLDNDVNAAFALVAEAMETSNVELLKDLLDPVMYSLLQDNFAEFARLHHHRLIVRDIRSKRAGVKITWRLPPFGNEVPSGLSLWGGNAIEYSQKANGKSLKDTRLWMMQAVGLNYALLRREQVVAQTPPGTQLPVPERFSTPNHIKRRVLAHINHPLIGDVISLIKYLLAVRRLGFDYVLRRGTIEFEVAYGFECVHNLSVLPIVEEPVDEKEEMAKTEEEKLRDRRARLLKYPELQNFNAPHVVLFAASFPIHSDGANLVTPKWRISEIDGMRNLERYEVAQLARLSANSPEEIDRHLPALRILSKELFTKFGPKKEWYEELRRLQRVAQNRLHHGSLDDPLEEIDNPVQTLLKHAEQHKDSLKNKSKEEGTTSPTAIGNIFDLAKDSNASKRDEHVKK